MKTKQINKLELNKNINNGWKATNKGVDMEAIELKRVCYGKTNTEPEDREYQLNGKGPVGTISEWITFANDNGLGDLNFTDKDCSFTVGNK